MGVQGWGPERALSRAWNAPLPPAPILAAVACGLTRHSASRAAVSPSNHLQLALLPLRFQSGTQWTVGIRRVPRGIGQREKREQRQRSCEAGGLSEDGVWTWFHSLRKGAWISASARRDSRHPEAPGSDFLCLDIIQENIFYPKNIF